MDHASHLPHPLGSHAGPADRLMRAVFWVEAVFRTARQRRQLMALDEHGLKDIGVSRADAYGEWSRPFWDLPREG